MDLNELKKLIKIIDDSRISEIEIEQEASKNHGRLRLRISKHPSASSAFQAQPVFTPPPGIYTHSPTPGGVQFESPETIEKTKSERPPDVVDMGNYIEVKSPIVGTFYRSPSPDAEPYVQPGTIVKPGQTLCIIEAMKIMNEIESEIHGKISKIFLENGQPVEYNQTLFLIEKI